MTNARLVAMSLASTLTVFGGTGVLAQASRATVEQQAKAECLLNMAKFVTWPACAFETTNSPLVIGVMGDPDFAAVLAASIGGHKADERAVIVQTCTETNAVRGCHFLFLGNAEKNRLPHILDALKDTPVLTIGETDGFQRMGGMIKFVVVEHKVHFQVNTAAAKQAGLVVSSKLLKLVISSDADEP